MLFSAYRFQRPILVVVREIRGYKLRELPAGTIFSPTGCRPDTNGMVDGTCDEAVVLVFERDLDERAEPMVGNQRTGTEDSTPNPQTVVAH